jgi:D-apionolactonase
MARLVMDRTLLQTYFGTEQSPVAVRRLTAGRLTAELVEGNLRTISYNGLEVLRAISYVVRDKDWGTYSPVIDELVVREGDNKFTVTYRAACRGSEGQNLTYRAAIHGTEAGVTFDVVAEPETDFLTNRCGFCILHPIVNLAGMPVTVQHTNGEMEQSTLPDLIEPWQPFKDMQAISHHVGPGLIASCRMEGGVWEMEDQRNWSDASYKTYVRPLALPWPYVMPRAVPDRQTVTLTIEDRRQQWPAASSALRQETITISLESGSGVAPKIGLVIAPEEVEATLANIKRLRQAGPQVLLCHFDPNAGHGRDAMMGLAKVAAAYPAEIVLECVVPCRDPHEAELEQIAELVRAAGLSLSAIAVSPSVDRQSTPPGSTWPECPPLEEVYASALKAFPGIRLGGGMFSYFTELNRKRVPVEKLGFVTHCTCPIVHAADDLSVMQSLEALPFITRSARAFIGDKPYWIGPSTIGMRQNPYGSRTVENPSSERVAMASWDPRQDGLFAAAWTIGYAARTDEAKLEVLTIGALTGPFGLLRDGSGAGQVRPVFHAASGLSSLAGKELVECRSSRPSDILAIGVIGEKGRPTIWAANVTDRKQSVRIVSENSLWTMTTLDQHSVEPASLGSLGTTMNVRNGAFEIEPFAITRLEAA